MCRSDLDEPCDSEVAVKSESLPQPLSPHDGEARGVHK